MRKTPKKARLGTAFVAMKFVGNVWRDRRYQAIADVLEEAGFKVLRADQIRSSGEVVREVLEHLRTADLIVVDTTGDSHSVSYELGYCHGIDRSPESLVLLRQDGSPIPFNFSHFRHLLYRDLKHLRRLLRDRLEVSIPLLAGQLGYALSFDVAPEAGDLGASVADAILAALRRVRFSGRCEYNAGDQFPGVYVVGLGLKQTRPRKELPYEWWSRFSGIVGSNLPKLTAKVQLNESHSELRELGSIRADLPARGVVELDDGRVARILSPDNAGQGSWFRGAAVRELTKQTPRMKRRAA